MRDNRHDCSPALQTKDCRLEPLDVVSVHSSVCDRLLLAGLVGTGEGLII